MMSLSPLHRRSLPHTCWLWLGSSWWSRSPHLNRRCFFNGHLCGLQGDPLSPAVYGALSISDLYRLSPLPELTPPPLESLPYSDNSFSPTHASCSWPLPAGLPPQAIVATQAKKVTAAVRLLFLSITWVRPSAIHHLRSWLCLSTCLPCYPRPRVMDPHVLVNVF
jgi:hypothetical protein